jgi:tetratricopeptide (TPR) repeat protein
MTGPATPDEFAEHVLALRRYADSHAQQYDMDEVRRAGEALISLDDDALSRAEPGLIREMLDATPSLLAAGDLEGAEHLLRKGLRALSVNPHATLVDLVTPLFNLMVVYDQKGDHDKQTQVAAAIASVAERLDEAPPSGATSALLQLGRLFEEDGNISVALVLYRPVHLSVTARAEVEPESLPLWVRTYARALMAGARHAEVVAVCREALGVARGGTEIELLGLIAAAAACMQDSATAEDALERAVAVAEAIESAGGFADRRTETAAGAAYHNLAVHYLARARTDRYHRSSELMRRALAIVLRQGGAGSAEHADALGQLAVITQSCGDLDAADRLYTESISVYEAAADSDGAELSEFATDLGMMRLLRGRPSDAVAPLRRAVELRNAAPAETPLRRADAASNLATAYFESGDLTAASREYTRALDLRFAGGAG